MRFSKLFWKVTGIVEMRRWKCARENISQHKKAEESKKKTLVQQNTIHKRKMERHAYTSYSDLDLTLDQLAVTGHHTSHRGELKRVYVCVCVCTEVTPFLTQWPLPVTPVYLHSDLGVVTTRVRTATHTYIHATKTIHKTSKTFM